MLSKAALTRCGRFVVTIDNVRGDKVTETVPGGESKVLGITVKSDPEDVVVGRTNKHVVIHYSVDGDFEVAQKFSIASPADQLAMATEYAALKGIPARGGQTTSHDE